MAYEFEIARVEPERTIGIRRRMRPEALGAFFAEVLPKAYGYAMANGCNPAGAPYARYHAWGEGEVDVEAGVVVEREAAARVRGEGDLVPGELPAGRAAHTTHLGPYESLNLAHRAMQGFLEQHGEHPAGTPWERYVTDPRSEPDPAKSRTEVYWPLGNPRDG